MKAFKSLFFGVKEVFPPANGIIGCSEE